jgi:hypothetical protein
MKANYYHDQKGKNNSKKGSFFDSKTDQELAQHDNWARLTVYRL